MLECVESSVSCDRTWRPWRDPPEPSPLSAGTLAKQIDVGFGDVVTPAPEPIKYPVLLDFPAAELLGYPRETVIAEKFHAMVYLGTLNSRMKDFFDVWLLAKQFPFDGKLLATAISATFANRGADVVAPIALTPQFTEQPSTRALWSAFRSRFPAPQCPEALSDVATVLTQLFLPVVSACAADEDFVHHWPPGGPWTTTP